MQNEKISKYIWMGIATLSVIVLLVKANEIVAPFYPFVPVWGILLWCIYHVNNQHLKNKDRLVISVLCLLQIIINVCMFLSPQELITILAVLLLPLSLISIILFALVISKAKHLKGWIISEIVVSILSLFLSFTLFSDTNTKDDDWMQIDGTYLEEDWLEEE